MCADLKKSAGHGKLIYAMKVDEQIPLAEYCRANAGKRNDAEHVIGEKGRFALISNHFYYFGRNAIDISEIPKKHLNHPFEKRGQGYRCDFCEEFIKDFTKWLNAKFVVGVHGPPCQPLSGLRTPKCPSKVRRKKCT